MDKQKKSPKLLPEVSEPSIRIVLAGASTPPSGWAAKTAAGPELPIGELPLFVWEQSPDGRGRGGASTSAHSAMPQMSGAHAAPNYRKHVVAATGLCARGAPSVSDRGHFRDPTTSAAAWMSDLTSSRSDAPHRRARAGSRASAACFRCVRNAQHWPHHNLPRNRATSARWRWQVAASLLRMRRSDIRGGCWGMP